MGCRGIIRIIMFFEGKNCKEDYTCNNQMSKNEMLGYEK